MPHQLTQSDRAVLAELLTMKLPKREIARRLGKHHSTIYRELARNTGPVGYIHQEAQQRTDVRRRLGRRKRKMNDPQVRKYVCRRLKQFWSPDQIAGRLELERRRPSKPQVSRQTIYAWIRASHGGAGPLASLLAFWGGATKTPSRRGPLAQRRPDRRSSGHRRFPSALRRLGRRHDCRSCARQRAGLARGTQVGVHLARARLQSPRGDSPHGSPGANGATARKPASHDDV